MLHLLARTWITASLYVRSRNYMRIHMVLLRFWPNPGNYSGLTSFQVNLMLKLLLLVFGGTFISTRNLDVSRANKRIPNRSVPSSTSFLIPSTRSTVMSWVKTLMHWKILWPLSEFHSNLSYIRWMFGHCWRLYWTSFSAPQLAWWI